MLHSQTQKDCENCRKKCCSTEPVFLTQYDIKRINKKTALLESKFVIEKVGYEKNIKLMRYKKGTCIFFDKKSGKCKIYEFRPLDCQLFPLDIDLRNGKYFLIFYNHCDLKDIPLKELKKEIQFAKSEIIPLLKSNLKEYAKLPMNLYNQKKWITIGQLSI